MPPLGSHTSRQPASRPRCLREGEARAWSTAWVPLLQPGVPGVAWAVPSPHGGAGLKAPPPASQTPRRTEHQADTWPRGLRQVPDLPGSPRPWLMDDPALSPPPPSECCCLQGHPASLGRSQRRPGGGAGGASAGLPSLLPPSHPICDSQVSPQPAGLGC